MALLLKGPVRANRPKRNVALIAHGTYTASAIDKNGNLWSWGNSGAGQVGVPELGGAVAVPNKIMYLQNKKFCKIKIGMNQDTRGANSGASFAIDENGIIWGAGRSNFGEITYAEAGYVSYFIPVWVDFFSTKTFCEIAPGRCHVYALDKNGKAWGWGAFSGRSSPVSVSGATKTFCKIATNTTTQMLIDKNGRAWGWGFNNNGIIGDNTTTSRATPVSVAGAVKTFCQINVSFGATQALDKNGKIWCWGNNTNGELGDNTTISKRTPVALGGATKTFCKLNGNGRVAYVSAIDKNGKVWSWGNAGGYLGDGSTTSIRLTPVSIYGNKTFCDIATGGNQTFLVDKNGRLWGWGFSKLYLGVEYYSYTKSPVNVYGNKTFCQVFQRYGSVGSYSLAIDKNGRVWGWGRNAAGTLGDNTTISRFTPVSVAGAVKTFCKIFPSTYSSSFAIDKNGKGWAWGSNAYGGLGNNSTIDRCTPFAIYGNKTFCHITGGEQFSAAIDKNGKTWVWGAGGGSMGDQTTTSKLTPVALYGNKTFCKICAAGAGAIYVFAIDKNGKGWAWGNGNINQLGNNSTIFRGTPVAICGNKTFCEICPIAAGGLGLDKNGQIWAWGRNSGQLAQNDPIIKSTPIIIDSSNNFCKIEGIYQGFYGLNSNGGIFSWGQDSYGALGINGYNSIQYPPISLAGLSKTFCKIAGGNYGAVNSFGLAIDKNGKGWAWGSNAYGSIGDNTTISRATPFAIYGNKTFCEITAGTTSAGAIDKNGKVWVWGFNTNAGLGDNTTISRRTPVALGGATKTFCKICAGTAHYLTIDKNGRLWSWGNNYYSQLGDNTGILKRTPVSVAGQAKTFCKIAARNSNSLAIDKNGRLWSWGEGYYGQLGNGENISKRTPVSVTGQVKTFCQISVGDDFAAAIDKNGKLWAWGNNESGQLGDNTTISRNTPVSIYGNKTFCQIMAKSQIILAIDNNNVTWAWGNIFSNFARDRRNITTPVAIKGQTKTFCKITSSLYEGIALDKNNNVWVWGLLYRAEGTTTLETPKMILQNISDINGWAAVDFNGKIWHWGETVGLGQGEKSELNVRTPIQICVI